MSDLKRCTVFFNVLCETAEDGRYFTCDLSCLTVLTAMRFTWFYGIKEYISCLARPLRLLANMPLLGTPNAVHKIEFETLQT